MGEGEVVLSVIDPYEPVVVVVVLLLVVVAAVDIDVAAENRS